jgi:hypothetical protein
MVIAVNVIIMSNADAAHIQAVDDGRDAVFPA